MNHEVALSLSASEKYLLNELPADLRDEFEEHFFECEQCALDVRAGAALLMQVKRELSATPETGRLVERQTARQRWYLLRPAMSIAAMAAMAFVIVYQNAVVFPRLKHESTFVNAPAILPAISLVGGTSRGDQVPSVVANGQTPVLLSVDVPTEDRFSRYTLTLYLPSGDLAWKIAASPEQARNTIHLEVPANRIQDGTYSLVVQGASGAEGNPADLVRYSFRVKFGSQSQ